VVKILELTVANRGRLRWNGVGSTEPRYRPETDPENEARNRRVEIIHLPGT
jgi:flagellar motor protein MotB